MPAAAARRIIRCALALQAPHTCCWPTDWPCWAGRCSSVCGRWCRRAGGCLCSTQVGPGGRGRRPVAARCASHVSPLCTKRAAARSRQWPLSPRRPFAGTRMPLTPPAVWNWWLLTAFFALGSAASLAAWRRRARQRRRAHGAAQPSRGVDWLGKATLATFCVVTPVSAGAAPTACYSRRGWGCGRCLRQRQAAPLPCAAPASRACAEGCQRGRRPPAAWVCRWLCW